MGDAPLRPNGLLGPVKRNETRSLTYSGGLLGAPSLLVPKTGGLTASGTLLTSTRSSLSSRTTTGQRIIEARTFDGKLVLLRPRTRTTIINDPLEPKTVNLLDAPLHRIIDEIKLEQESRNSKPDDLHADPTNHEPEDTLWVDRYRPKRFTDLLGDERVHRETMAWVKEWDYCVFGTNKRRKRARDEMEGTDSAYHDELQRPRERILLLSGPPGLGKTTLAHVVARQAGYDVMEINASDARTGQVVDERIRPALESGSAVGSKRPVLVVIDEIDGASGAGENSGQFVQKLLQLTIDRPNKKGRKSDKGAARPLRRPIICICNDLYAASISKLRPQARIIRFHRPTDVHLVKRLRDICEREGLQPDTRALSTLVGIAQGDMRGCLNTLQFVKSKNQELSEAVVRAATTGMKEADVAFTAVLNDLFVPISKRRVKELGLREEEEFRYVSRLSRSVEASAALEKIFNGCFEHYLNVHRQDGTLTRHNKAAAWLCVYDSMSSMMKNEREYAVLPYLPYMAVPFFTLFSERGASKVERPKADWEHFLKTKQSEEIYKSLSRDSGRNPEYRHMLCHTVLQLEFAPLINRIISPPLRPVNSQVIRPEEKKLLARLVEIMVALDLRFIQEKSEDGNLVYRLDPPIDVFITYDGKRASDISVSRYAVRHLVAAEIDERAIHRRAELSETTKRPSTQIFEHDQDTEAVADEESGGQLVAGSATTSAYVKSSVKPTQEKGPVDFFGRPLTVSAASRKKAATPVVKKFKVSFRYHEGNSSAVRKPVKMSTLL